MLLEGEIDNSNNLWVEIEVRGEYTSQTIHAIIDTGFTGELLLPQQIAIELGLKKIGVAPCKLANGSEIQQVLYSASILWGTNNRNVTVHVAEKVTSALIGGGLFHNYVLHADFGKKQLLIKEPHTDEPSVN